MSGGPTTSAISRATKLGAPGSSDFTSGAGDGTAAGICWRDGTYSGPSQSSGGWPETRARSRSPGGISRRAEGGAAYEGATYGGPADRLSSTAFGRGRSVG